MLKLQSTNTDERQSNPRCVRICFKKNVSALILTNFKYKFNMFFLLVTEKKKKQRTLKEISYYLLTPLTVSTNFLVLKMDHYEEI